MYACSAQREGRARCRNLVETNGALCPTHQGRGAELAPRPDIILVKFNISPNWCQRFEEAGVLRSSPSEVELEEKHIVGAQKLGRDAYVYRDIADSGVPIFGREGVQQISISGLLPELEREGYKVSGVHIRTRTQKKFDVLVISFELAGESGRLLAEAIALVKEFLRVSCWGFVHVWANPPDGKGRIPHTVNLGHREVDKVPVRLLRFNRGLWAAVPA